MPVTLKAEFSWWCAMVRRWERAVNILCHTLKPTRDGADTVEKGFDNFESNWNQQSHAPLNQQLSLEQWNHSYLTHATQPFTWRSQVFPALFAWRSRTINIKNHHCQSFVLVIFRNNWKVCSSAKKVNHEREVGWAANIPHFCIPIQRKREQLSIQLGSAVPSRPLFIILMRAQIGWRNDNCMTSRRRWASSMGKAMSLH